MWACECMSVCKQCWLDPYLHDCKEWHGVFVGDNTLRIQQSWYLPQFHPLPLSHPHDLCFFPLSQPLPCKNKHPHAALKVMNLSSLPLPPPLMTSNDVHMLLQDTTSMLLLQGTIYSLKTKKETLWKWPPLVERRLKRVHVVESFLFRVAKCTNPDSNHVIKPASPDESLEISL